MRDSFEKAFYVGVKLWDTELYPVNNIKEEKMTKQQAKEATLAVWRFLRDNPECRHKEDMPLYLRTKIIGMQNQCPLCQYFRDNKGEYICRACPLKSCGRGSLWRQWRNAHSNSERRSAAAKIVEAVEAWCVNDCKFKVGDLVMGTSDAPIIYNDSIKHSMLIKGEVVAIDDRATNGADIRVRVLKATGRAEAHKYLWLDSRHLGLYVETNYDNKDKRIKELEAELAALKGAPFKVGDYVTGKPDAPYSITNHNMYKGKVTSVYDQYNIVVKIVEHKDGDYIDSKHIVQSKYFVPYKEKETMPEALVFPITLPSWTANKVYFNKTEVVCKLKLHDDGIYYSKDILFCSARDTDRSTGTDYLITYLNLCKSNFQEAVGDKYKVTDVILPNHSLGVKEYNGVTHNYWTDHPRKAIDIIGNFEGAAPACVRGVVVGVKLEAV